MLTASRDFSGQARRLREAVDGFLTAVRAE